MATNSESVLLPGTAFADSAGVVNARAMMRRNVCFGLLDYIVQPLLMLTTARYFVRHLGIAEFGVWMLVLAVIGSSGSLCTGFGDAALKYISMGRGRCDYEGVAKVIQSSLTLNLTFGLSLAVVFCTFTPWASTHVFRLNRNLAPIFIAALRIGALVLVLRSVAFVFISALRAFENYRAATQITSATRIAIVATALILITQGRGVVAIMVGTLICELVAITALLFAVRGLLPVPLKPGIRLQNSRHLISFGAFSWLQALLGTVFSQADRLLIAALLGPAALAYYGICIQAAQPIHGLAAAGSNVLFPHLSARLEQGESAMVGSTLWRAVRLNFICVLVLSLPLLFLSRSILNRWMGADFSLHAASSLSLVALSFAFLAFNIPGHYALLAFGRVRFLTALNLFGGAVSLLVAFALIPHLGIVGAAIGRLLYGPITWLLYPKLIGMFRERALANSH